MSILITASCAAATGSGLGMIALTALRPKTKHSRDCVPIGTSGPDGTPGRKPRPSRSMPLVRLLICAGTGVGLLLITSWPVLLPIGSAAAWFLPELLRSDGGSAAKIAKVESIATFAEMMRDTLNAAAGLGQAISAAARCATGPIAPEARRLAAAIEDRAPIDQALRSFGDELADPAGDLVVLALTYAARNSASDLAGLLSDLADAARAEAAMRVRIGVARARTRTAVRMITGVTLGLGAVLYAFDESFLAPYSTALGQLGLLAISILFAIGFGWLARLSCPTEQPRLLRSEPPTGGTDMLDVTLLPSPRRGNVPTFSSGAR